MKAIAAVSVTTIVNGTGEPNIQAENANIVNVGGTSSVGGSLLVKARQSG